MIVLYAIMRLTNTPNHDTDVALFHDLSQSFVAPVPACLKCAAGNVFGLFS